jgi:hypothetical protein
MFPIQEYGDYACAHHLPYRAAYVTDIYVILADCILTRCLIHLALF